MYKKVFLNFLGFFDSLLISELQFIRFNRQFINFFENFRKVEKVFNYQQKIVA